MKHIICIGDSNTRGFDPRSWCGEEYDHPWPEILAELTGQRVVNLGENGREIPHTPGQLERILRSVREMIPGQRAEGEVENPSGDTRAADPDIFLIIMLGTNDILNGSVPTAEAFRERLLRFVLHMRQAFPGAEMLVMSPILPRMFGFGSFCPEESSAVGVCRRIAGEADCLFLEVASLGLPLAFDGVHLTEEGHRLLAEEIGRFLAKNVAGSKNPRITGHTVLCCPRMC